MLLSTQTSFLSAEYGHEQAIRMLKEAGFDAFDMSLFSMFGDKDDAFNQDDYREYAQHLRAVADEIGIVCNQAHAPFGSSTGEPEEDEKRFAAIVRSLEIASILGAKIIVVHPKQHLPYTTNAAELREINLQFYNRLLPYCEKWNIKVACENMWQYHHGAGHICDSTCSRPAEFCDYVDAINSPFVVACLDIGHTELTDEDPAYFIRTLGHDRLQALHVHDNELKNDLHTLPFTEKIDFDAITTALADIDYAGDFTFEADQFIKHFPRPLHAEATHLMCSVGRYLIAEIERKKKA